MLCRTPAEAGGPDQGILRPLWGPRTAAHEGDTQHAQPPRLRQHRKSLQQPGPDPHPRYGTVGGRAPGEVNRDLDVVLLLQTKSPFKGHSLHRPCFIKEVARAHLLL